MIKMNLSKFLGRWSAVFGFLLAGLLFTGCSLLHSSEEPPSAEPAGDVLGAQAATNILNSDLINVGDSLTIVFSDLPNSPPAFEVKVREDGTITLIENQTFTAAGKTRGQLEKEIRELYVPAYYVKMTVTIKVQERVFFVGGEVRNSGRQVYSGPMTVTKAIQSAGGFTDFANKKRVRLTRADGKTTLIINCIMIIEHPERDPPVYPGDKIDVPRRFF